ncbi:hypothetical protein E2C01_088948 [Portunus trituberculatus]|uniref:Uncharacterized protein n=1 Tax=Portunus trituberculatus TaxID=210409 RepID=A0A5B7JHT9_PORTR|nr:hypothetical protein [Portunus trituberculatus]
MPSLGGLRSEASDGGFRRLPRRLNARYRE